MRLSTFRRCGADTVSRQGIKGSKPVWLEYNAEATRLHKLECPRVPAQREVAR